MNQKNILLIYPSAENTTKKLTGILGLIWRKDYTPSRELIEISIQLPITWEKRIIDLNFELLKKEQLEWADLVIIKANVAQQRATLKAINSCNKHNKTIIATGSLFSNNQELIKLVDHFIPDSEDFYKFSEEFEETVPQKVYRTEQKRILPSKWIPEYSLKTFTGMFLRNIQLFSS